MTFDFSKILLSCPLEEDKYVIPNEGVVAIYTPTIKSVDGECIFWWWQFVEISICGGEENKYAFYSGIILTYSSWALWYL